MTDDRTPEEQILDDAFAPDGFPDESEFDLDKPGVLAGLGPQAAAELRGQFEAARAGWQIDGEHTAAWCASKLRRAEARIEEARAARDRMLEAADAYLEAVQDRTGHDVAFFTGKLHDWYREVGGEGKTKTRHILGADLSETVGGVSANITDEAALIVWLEENRPSALKYPEEPTIVKGDLDFKGKVDKTQPGEYPAVDEATGEIVPGLMFERGEPAFKVKLHPASER